MECCCVVGVGYVLFGLFEDLIAYSAIDIVVDNCAICRNHIMDLCMFILLGINMYVHLLFIIAQVLNVKQTKLRQQAKVRRVSILLLVLFFIFAFCCVFFLYLFST